MVVKKLLIQYNGKKNLEFWTELEYKSNSWVIDKYKI